MKKDQEIKFDRTEVIQTAALAALPIMLKRTNQFLGEGFANAVDVAIAVGIRFADKMEALDAAEKES